VEVEVEVEVEGGRNVLSVRRNILSKNI